MTIPGATARAAIVEDVSWEKALRAALERTRGIFPDLAIVFASPSYAEHFPELVRLAWQETGASVLIGCSGQGLIGGDQELEDVPAIALLTVALPGASLRPVRFTRDMIETDREPSEWPESLAAPANSVNAWLVFADPFRMDCESLVNRLAAAYPGRPMLGGLASAGPSDQKTHVFLNGDVYGEGGVGLAIGGLYSILPIVSQGCEPIGEPWTITVVKGNVIQTISNRPAYDVLVETFQGLPDDVRRRAQRNLLVGLAADEYRHEFRRGDFLIRNLMGIDRRSGALAIGAYPRIGQTVQFQIRDGNAADGDLNEMLDQARQTLGERQPIAGILCSCNGRGVGLFGTPDHDAGAIADKLAPLPLAGLFCNGEIGPVGARPFLHGFTASLALLIEAETP